MNDGGSLINLGDISKPATVLIEKISEAVGGLYRPRQIIRVAKAEADAKKVLALADIEISEVQQRAITRMIEEEGKKQKNIEEITAEATKKLNDSAKPENIENDWLAHFFEKCRIVSDKEMQNLWANLLSGEANIPGTYSKRTVDLVATLDKKDANLFTALCSFMLSGGDPFPIVFDANDDIYSNKGITFSNLSHLEYIGLIKFNNFQELVLQKMNQHITLLYFGIPISFKLSQQENNNFKLGHVVFTKSGRELAPICGAIPDMEFLKYMIKKYRDLGYEVNCPVA